MLEPKAVGADWSLQVWGSMQSQGLNRGPAGTRHATLTLELSPWPISNLQSYFSSIEQPSQGMAGTWALQKSMQEPVNTMAAGPTRRKGHRQICSLLLASVCLYLKLMLFLQNIPTKDRLEGMAAFREKRPPKFVGE